MYVLIYEDRIRGCMIMICSTDVHAGAWDWNIRDFCNRIGTGVWFAGALETGVVPNSHFIYLRIHIAFIKRFFVYTNTFFVYIHVCFLLLKNFQRKLSYCGLFAASRNASGDVPPPYSPPTGPWYQAPPPAYAPNPSGYYGWAPPYQAFPGQPPGTWTNLHFVRFLFCF